MKTKFKYLLGVSLTLFAAVTATQAAGHGGHGGGGGSGGGSSGGTIYFNTLNGAMFSMNSDGSNQTPLGSGLSGSPSQALHNGHRWFVNSLPYTGKYPNGAGRSELFAFRDDYDWANNNTTSTRVQLTNNPLLQPGGVEWVPGDGLISFIGRRWASADPGSPVVEGGIYTATLAFDAAGGITGLVAQPVTPTLPLPLVETTSGDFVADVGYYSWDSAADMVAYSNSADNGLWVADLFGGSMQIYNGQAHMAVWSPDSSTIAFTRGDGIHTIKPDGTGQKWIVASTSTWFFNHAYWSYDSSSLVFNGTSLVDNHMDLFSANAHGSHLVRLTNTTPPDSSYIFEWHGGWVQ